MNRNNAGNIEIAFDKSKINVLLAGSVIFVLTGLWFTISPPHLDGGSDMEIFVRSVGIICVLFFGFGAYFFYKKLKDRSPALIISPLGVTDNSSAVCAGFIPWNDIIEIKDYQMLNQTFVNIIVSDPAEYIAKQSNPFKRKLAQMNYSSFGVAIGISCNGLKCSHYELRSMLDTGFRQYKK